jgi:hypothetical protein
LLWISLSASNAEEQCSNITVFAVEQSHNTLWHSIRHHLAQLIHAVVLLVSEGLLILAVVFCWLSIEPCVKWISSIFLEAKLPNEWVLRIIKSVGALSFIVFYIRYQVLNCITWWGEVRVALQMIRVNAITSAKGKRIRLVPVFSAEFANKIAQEVLKTVTSKVASAIPAKQRSKTIEIANKAVQEVMKSIVQDHSRGNTIQESKGDPTYIGPLKAPVPDPLSVDTPKPSATGGAPEYSANGKPPATSDKNPLEPKSTSAHPTKKDS